jgi:hypothetical protein
VQPLPAKAAKGLYGLEEATHHFGPLTIGELGVRGPDDLDVTLLEQTVRRRPLLSHKLS